MKSNINTEDPLPKVTLLANGEKLDELLYKDFVSINEKHYLLTEDSFKKIQSPYIQIDLQNLTTEKNNQAASTRNHINLTIEGVQDIRKKILFGKGWYNEEKSLEGTESWRWMGEKSVCYIKNSEKDVTLNITGSTSIKHFKKPLKVVVTLFDKKIDEFTIPNNILSRVRAKLTDKLFSRTYNINGSYLQGKEWLELVIGTDQSYTPDDLFHNGDKRKLSLRISGISAD